MPLVDKPLLELLKYQGRNPKPADFDSYWDDALAEMEAIDPQVELVPHPISGVDFAETFDLFFTGVGGSRVHAQYIRPKKAEKPGPALLQFHGYSGNSGDWAPKLRWAAAGFAVAALDCRGQGGQSDDLGGARGMTLRGHIVRGLDDPDPRKLGYRQIFLDTAQLAKIVSGFREIDGDRLGAYGGSQGGALTLACAALAPIKRALPVYPFLCDYQRVWEMDLAKDAYDELKYFFRMFDPNHERENEIFTRLGYIDCQHLAPRITGEILMAVGLMDTICPPSSQFAAYNKITSKKSLKVYPDFGHEGLPWLGDVEWEFFAGL
ncbi:MAG: acetylxylan esterase [Chthoniobacterales bacterium]